MSSSSRKRAARHRPVAADGALFEQPFLYDLAFGFRDFPAQCDGILSLAHHYAKKKPRSVLELCCGQAHHLREFARRGFTCFGIDDNREMLAYARRLSARDRVSVNFVRADIRSFEIPARVDLAYCLFDSFCHCTSDNDAISSLRSTAGALRRGGLLILELTHPGDFFTGVRSRSLSRWTRRLPGVKIKTRFAHTDIDPIAETFVPSITIEVHYGNGRQPLRIVDRLHYRIWLAGSLKYVVAASGCFDIVGWHGDLTPDVPLGMRDDAWQMVVVLRRR